jgi:hypothetical protein
MALCHDFMHLSIMKSMASYRFDKIGRQVIYFVREQNTLFRRIVPVDQFPSSTPSPLAAIALPYL